MLVTYKTKPTDAYTHRGKRFAGRLRSKNADGRAVSSLRGKNSKLDAESVL